LLICSCVYYFRGYERIIHKNKEYVNIFFTKNTKKASHLRDAFNFIFKQQITSSQEEPLQAQLPAVEFAVAVAAADMPQGQVPSSSLPLLSS
jgi:hypothetical protein